MNHISVWQVWDAPSSNVAKTRGSTSGSTVGMSASFICLGTSTTGAESWTWLPSASDLGFSLTFGVRRAGDDGADISRIEPSSVALASVATPASESMATYNSSGCPVPSNGLMAGGGSRVPALGVSGSLLMAFQAFRLCPDDDPGSLRSEPGAAGDSGSWDKRGLALALSLIHI